MRGNITKQLSVFSAATLIAGCAAIKQESFMLSDGRKVDYIHGKVDADGQTGVFRDAFIDGTPVLSHFGSGQSLLGQVLQGTASSAMIAGGMVGAAAVLRPARYNNTETNNLDNKQQQQQQQEQGQASFNDTHVSTKVNSNSSAGAASVANSNSTSNANSSAKGYGGAGGNSSTGPINSCNGVASC